MFIKIKGFQIIQPEDEQFLDNDRIPYILYREADPLCKLELAYLFVINIDAMTDFALTKKSGCSSNNRNYNNDENQLLKTHTVCWLRCCTWYLQLHIAFCPH